MVQQLVTVSVSMVDLGEALTGSSPSRNTLINSLAAVRNDEQRSNIKRVRRDCRCHVFPSAHGEYVHQERSAPHSMKRRPVRTIGNARRPHPGEQGLRPKRPLRGHRGWRPNDLPKHRQCDDLQSLCQISRSWPRGGSEGRLGSVGSAVMKRPHAKVSPSKATATAQRPRPWPRPPIEHHRRVPRPGSCGCADRPLWTARQ